MKVLPIIILIFFLKGMAMAQDIVKAEYFIDDDAGFGQNVDIPIPSNLLGPNFELNFTIDLNNVNPGLHHLYIRVKDDQDFWSLYTYTTLFVVEDVPVPSIDALEYFFDADPGFGNGIQVNITGNETDNTIIFDANLDDLAPGTHFMYIRARSAEGEWSLLSSRLIQVLEDMEQVNIVRLEYFFEGNGFTSQTYSQPIQDPSPVVEFDFQANASELTNGETYTLSVWAIDDEERKSLVNTISFLYSEVVPIVLSVEKQNESCEGLGDGQLTANATGGEGTLLYSIDGTNFSANNVFPNLTSGTYTVTVKGDVPDYSVAEEATVEADHENPEVPNITELTGNDGSIILESTEAFTYQWFLNDQPISGASSRQYQPQESGEYQVSVANEGGCSALSEKHTVSIDVTAIYQQADTKLIIYPNPVVDELIIESKSGINLLGAEIELRTISGKLLLSGKAKTNVMKVDFSPYPKGMYQLIIITDQLVLQKKLLMN
ncbi:T9SS type A sorting domain-containing protein [Fulvivirgaceae bacterium BMA10]|uniref:T9SS type A sorting domain-containing protein n=1 Tax=Splendidivirga corallicola TaxID=3051826 RepID=A0ABT8KV94_9BACT|nr:T9SS type A sorting domain-containing protein [Fulvivirgaceae bacterium BMA10]